MTQRLVAAHAAGDSEPGPHADIEVLPQCLRREIIFPNCEPTLCILQM
jgi:hypothetical protein